MDVLKLLKFSIYAGTCFIAAFGMVFVPIGSGWVAPGAGVVSTYASEGESGESDSEETTVIPRTNRTNPNTFPRFRPNTNPRSHGAPPPRATGHNPHRPTPASRVRLSDPATDAVVSDLSSIVAECSILPREYRADCLAQNLIEASRVVNTSGYAQVNKQLKSAGQQISKEVSRNVDRSKPTIKHAGKTLRAVKKSAVSRVNRKATRIVKSTAKKLIRSAGNSAVKKVHFTRIAKAVDNTKVLLRSA